MYTYTYITPYTGTDRQKPSPIVTVADRPTSSIGETIYCVYARRINNPLVINACPLNMHTPHGRVVYNHYTSRPPRVCRVAVSA